MVPDKCRRGFAAALAAAAILAPQLAAAAAPTQIGAWFVSTGYDGRATYNALLQSDGAATLVVTCDSSGLGALVSYLRPLKAEGETAQIRYSVGAAHRAASWRISDDRLSLLAPDPASARALLSLATGGRTLAVSSEGVTSSFDLTGVREVARLLGACPAR